MAVVLKYESKVAIPTIVLFVIAWTIFILSTYFAYHQVIPMALAIPVNGIMAYILFTPMHEAGHMNVSGGKKNLRFLDEIVGWLSGIPLLAPFYVFKVIHFRHHGFTNNPEKDPDHWLASKNIFALLFHATTIFPVYMVKAHQLMMDKKTPKAVKKDLAIGLVGLIILLALIPISSILFGWSNVLLLWVIPALIAETFLAFAFDWLPHHPHEQMDKFLNTRVIHIPGISILLLSQNYHLIHHLQPRIPFYEYKENYLKNESTFKKEGVQIIE